MYQGWGWEDNAYSLTASLAWRKLSYIYQPTCHIGINHQYSSTWKSNLMCTTNYGTWNVILKRFVLKLQYMENYRGYLSPTTACSPVHNPNTFTSTYHTKVLVTNPNILSMFKHTTLHDMNVNTLPGTTVNNRLLVINLNTLLLTYNTNLPVTKGRYPPKKAFLSTFSKRGWVKPN